MLGLHTFQRGRRLFNRKRCPTSSELGAYDTGFPTGCVEQKWPNGLAKTKMVLYIYSTYMYLYVLSYPRPPQKQQDQYGKKMWENFQEDVAERPAPMVFCSGFFLGVKNPGGPPARPAASNLRECPTRRSR